MELITAYFRHLEQNPERIDSLLMWTVCTFVCWLVLTINRHRILTGLSGLNQLFESAEVVIYLVLWTVPPIVFYTCFFEREYILYVWIFLAGCIGWAVTGRFIFDWALAMRNGSAIVKNDSESKQEQK